MISKRFFIRKERYIAYLLDRLSEGPVLVASAHGGVDIEKVAEEHPNSIVKVLSFFFQIQGVDNNFWFKLIQKKEKIEDIDVGPTDEQLKSVAQKLLFTSDKFLEFSDQMKKLYKLMIERDALMIEVNPFVETSNGECKPTFHTFKIFQANFSK